jgi:sulfate adenylyltransferase subunit 1 (EFTu-like GTPase family)
MTPSYIIPVSARNGDNLILHSPNMLWYDGSTVIQALDSICIASIDENKEFRFPIQDIYGDIIVGRIESGSISQGDEVVIMPEGYKIGIRSIEVFEKQISKACKGESIGLKIYGEADIYRGQVICSKPLPEPFDLIKATIFCISEHGLKADEPLKIKIATQETGASLHIKERIDAATLQSIDDCSHLENAEIGIVMIKCESPLIFEDFSSVPELGRFVLEKQNNVIAGGVIVNKRQ